MSELIIQPTAKFLRAGISLTTLVFLAIEIAYFVYWQDKEALKFLPLVAPLLFLWPGVRWLRRRYVQQRLSYNKLWLQHPSTDRYFASALCPLRTARESTIGCR